MKLLFILFLGLFTLTTIPKISYETIPEKKELAVEIPVQEESVRIEPVNVYHRLHNEYREANNLQPLVYDYNLQKSASVKAEDLCVNNYWSHDRPDGEAFWVNIKRYNNYIKAGENLASGYSSPEATFIGWQKSPAHNKNILNPRWDFIGIGVYDCERNKVTYVVAHFKY